jgi:bifunctional non-homologous end joining protein LigD
MSLREYNRKRRFDETPEPAAEKRGTASKRSKRPIFVVQLHHARARHYDFRLEVDGALKSWAVPKGPSLRPGDKRLAVEVEDHPLAYASFAGDIPQGHYGAGHVDIFDHGGWTPDGDPLAALAKGHLDFELHGDKLRGHWTLVRTRLQGSKQQWLLIKRSDAEARDLEADDLVDAAPRRSRSAHAVQAPAKKAVAEKPAAKKSPAKKALTPRKASATWRKRALALASARDRPLHAGFKPQLCTLEASPPRGEDWLHETKWDGYRLLADLDDGKAALRSRNDLDWTAKFADVAAAIEALPVASARLDGELIAVDARGNSDFSALQRSLEAGTHAALRYVLFDLPALEQVDLTQVALAERKDLLQALLHTSKKNALSFSTHIVGHGERVFEAARRQGLEGIVSKRVDARYVEGRAKSWVKVKHANTDEFVIVGYTAPKGSREGFGSLLLATVERGALRYVGRVGSGFDDALLRQLTRQLGSLAQADAVLRLPAHVPFRASAVRWVAPRLVAEVEFRGWAKEGLLRQASFLRLRDDKTTEDLGMPERKTTTLKPARAAAKKATGGGVTITHPERIVFPDTSITKQDVADYYRDVADRLLPELVDRPLSVVRCPDGAGGTCFFQKHHAASLGSNVAAIALKEKDGGSDEYLYVKDLRGVLELVQMNVLEFHPWGARIDAPERADRLVFDLDPGPGVDWKALVAGARDVRARLADAGLESFVRLSGGKGVHVVVPIRGTDWSEAKAFCEAFADAMATQQPLHYLATASKAKRDGRIFIDWLRNARGATSVASWSLRARAGAPVAMPLRWDELGRTKGAADFDLAGALRRAKSLRKDPWEGFERLEQALPRLD